jgi:hypothetical protein
MEVEKNHRIRMKKNPEKKKKDQKNKKNEKKNC